MYRPPFLQILSFSVAFMSGLGLRAVYAQQSPTIQSTPEPAPPAITVAGSRIGFTRDVQTGRIGVHFSGAFHSDHVDILKKQENLGTVFFSGMRPPLTDEGLKLLHDVPLTGLFLSNVPVTDKGLEALKGHAHIESILLYKTQVTDACIDTLATCPNLVKLSFDYADITDAGLEKIASLKHLKSVGFFKCQKITDKGVIHLTQLESLNRLFLNNNEQLTRQIVKPLVALKNLMRLELDQIPLKADDVAELARLPKLETLGLSNTTIDDEGAMHLSQMPSLKSLVIQGCAISEAGVERLCERNPSLTVFPTPQSVMEKRLRKVK